MLSVLIHGTLHSNPTVFVCCLSLLELKNNILLWSCLVLTILVWIKLFFIFAIHHKIQWNHASSRQEHVLISHNYYNECKNFGSLEWVLKKHHYVCQVLKGLDDIQDKTNFKMLKRIFNVTFLNLLGPSYNHIRKTNTFRI